MLFILCLHQACGECKVASCCQLHYFWLRASQTWPWFHYLQVEGCASPRLQGLVWESSQGSRKSTSRLTADGLDACAWSWELKTQHFHTIFFTSLWKCHPFWASWPTSSLGMGQTGAQRAQAKASQWVRTYLEVIAQRQVEWKELGLSPGHTELWTSVLLLSQWLPLSQLQLPHP